MKKRKIKKIIEYKQLKIVLYDYKPDDSISIQSNIEAFDSNGSFLWVAENCPSGRYFDMQIDESNDTIETDDGGSIFYDIELTNGKIVKSQFRK